MNMNHRERSTAFAEEVVQAREDLDWETFARFLAKQFGWARDKILRGEQLCMNEWDKAHMRTVAQALAPDHPLMKRFKAQMKATGKKFDESKPQVDLVPTELVIQVAKVLGHGAEKYGRFNWRGGIPWSRLVAAALRHIYAWIDGEDLDSAEKGGSGLPHLAHAACELAFLLQLAKERPDLDDRYRPVHPVNYMRDELSGGLNASLGDGKIDAFLGDAR